MARRATMLLVCTVLLGLPHVAGCLGPVSHCVPGEAQACPCTASESGVQVCQEDGHSFGPCRCGPSPSGDAVLDGSFVVLNELDIETLRPYVRITGYLLIAAPGLPSFDLPHLARVDGNLLVQGCTNLTSLDGFGALTTVGGALEIEGNDALRDVNGLRALESIGADLFVSHNPSLADLDGLEHLTSVGGLLYLETNPSLASIEGLRGLTAIGGPLWIWDNDSLTSFEGLQNLRELGGGLCFSNDDSLTDVSALSGITHIPGDLHVLLDHSLEELHGLHNVATIDGSVYIGSREGASMGTIALRSLDGLAGLSAIGGDLDISHNRALVDISGLVNLTALGRDLFVLNNTALPTCAAEALAEQLAAAGWQGAALIAGNPPDGC